MADLHISVCYCLFLNIVLFTFSISVLCSFTLIFNFLLVSPTCFFGHPTQSMVYTPSFGPVMSIVCPRSVLSVLCGFMADVICFFLNIVANSSDTHVHKVTLPFVCSCHCSFLIFPFPLFSSLCLNFFSTPLSVQPG